MADLEFAVPTSKKSMAEIRPVLDAALAEAFPSGMVSLRWSDDRVELAGPGAKGTITLEGGQLVGRATLGPPANLLRSTIEEKIGEAMRKAAG